MSNFLHVDLASPAYLEDRDTGDEHQYPRLSEIQACPACDAPCEPEPTNEERAQLLADADYTWFPPDGMYLTRGFGLMGGGYGPYVTCDRCGFFLKEYFPDGAE